MTPRVSRVYGRCSALSINCVFARVAPAADLACALAAVRLTLGDTIRQWDTANNPTGLPQVEEPLPGTSNRVFMPAVLQGQ